MKGSVGRWVLTIAVFTSPFARAAEIPWRSLQPGVEYGVMQWPRAPGPRVTIGDGRLHVVRIQPKAARLVLETSGRSTANRTARRWSEDRKLAVVINAGMFAEDYVTHVGYLRGQDNQHRSVWDSRYKSIFAFGPKKAGSLGAVMIDRGTDPFRPQQWAVVVQNLRLIRAPGRNVWSANRKQWSEAALAQDAQGRILFLFSRSPLTMRDFNRKLLAAGLSVVRAQHLEGGPEASLSIHAGGVDIDLAGSYETDFNENDDNRQQWKLPNVLGVAAVNP